MSIKSFFADLFHESPVSHVFSRTPDYQEYSGTMTSTYTNNWTGQYYEVPSTYRYTVQETITEWLAAEKVGGDRNALVLKHHLKSEFNRISGHVPTFGKSYPYENDLDGTLPGVYTEEQAITKISEWEAERIKKGQLPTTKQPFKSAIKTKLTQQPPKAA